MAGRLRWHRETIAWVMLYQKQDSQGHYRLRLASSEDGLVFMPMSDAPVFTGETGSWDAISITTARLFQAQDWFYMLYGGQRLPV